MSYLIHNLFYVIALQMGSTTMEFCCLNGNVEMVTLLLEQGVDPNTQNEVHSNYYSL